MKYFTIRKFLIVSILFAVLAILNDRCLSADTTFTKIPPGIWRGVLELEKFRIPVSSKDTIFSIYEQFKPGELPFNFEVTYTDDEHFYIDILNGSERIHCDSIRYGRNRMLARDTFNFYFPEYQSYIHTEVRGGVMTGEWIVTTKKDYRIPFYAHAGRGYRFTALNEKPLRDISGEWATLFGIGEKNQDKAIGEFKQTGNRLEGTFRTETGDYRYLEGTMQGRRFWLSCFDGAHAYLFSGNLQGDSLQGEFRSGKSEPQLWSAWRDPNFQLGNADSLTTLKNNAGNISFAVKTPDGRDLVYPGPAFDGKIKIFTIMGTWCPNCRDEQNFLTEYLKNNPDAAKDLAIVGCSFERNQDVTAANAHLAEYKKKMGIPFDIVYAGPTGKSASAEASKFFPALNKVMAFPTMLIIDKNNRVRQIHTGFDGPATSKYGAFKQEFSKLIKEMRAE